MIMIHRGAGMLAPAQAWDRLREGFADAEAKSDSDGTLEQVAADMHATHAFRRVYWSGAAYWLTVDRDLRRASNGKHHDNDAIIVAAAQSAEAPHNGPCYRKPLGC